MLNSTSTKTITQTKERPILFSIEMVRAILEGRKTQTRRVMKPHPLLITLRRIGETNNGALVRIFTCGGKSNSTKRGWTIRCPYGVPGDRLWVRETFAIESNFDTGREYDPPFNDGRPIKWVEGDRDFDRYWKQAHYRATDPTPDLCCESDKCRRCEIDGYGPHWQPSIHMPRWASRILLEITDVRVERLQEISEEDAMAEGIKVTPNDTDQIFNPSAHAYMSLWNELHDKGAWDRNPWVWVIGFKRLLQELG